MRIDPQTLDTQPAMSIKSLPDESNREAIEEMLLHSYEFAVAMGLTGVVATETKKRKGRKHGLDRDRIDRIGNLDDRMAMLNDKLRVL